MIGNTVIGRGFSGCVRYNLDKVEKGLGEILEVRGVREYSKSLMTKDFTARKRMNTKLTRCVWHTSLSFQDNLNKEQVLKISKDWIESMGLDKTQYAIIRHFDTDHPHVHIIANRINDKGITISDSNNWKRSQSICEKLIEKYQLTPVPEFRNEEKINREKLRGKDLLKTDLNRVIYGIIKTSKDIGEFIRGMESSGFNVSIRLNPDQSIRGLSFERDGVKIKASDIHHTLSAKNIIESIRANIHKVDQKPHGL